ncbi:MAG TPA: hypothetical protein VGP58_13275 [Pyrinomonadaceae bacterium]|nr:hypothetical protein [Pyrinomonadaceae bacterium]
MKETIQIVLGLFFLFAFVSQMSAQSVLKDGKIPRDLVITLSFSSTIQFSAEYDLKITADGKVYLNDRSHLLPSQTFFNLMLLEMNGKKLKKSKIPKLKDRISQKQIKQIILEFEKSGFFEMNEFYYGDPILNENVCTNHADIKSLSILANGKTKNVAFFLGCSYSEKSPLEGFSSLYDKISKELSSVKKMNLKTN